MNEQPVNPQAFYFLNLYISIGLFKAIQSPYLSSTSPIFEMSSNYSKIADENQIVGFHGATHDELPVLNPSIPSEASIDIETVSENMPAATQGPDRPHNPISSFRLARASTTPIPERSHSPDHPQTPMPSLELTRASTTPDPARPHSPMPSFRLVQVWTRNKPPPMEEPQSSPQAEPQPSSPAISDDGSEWSTSSSLSFDGVLDSVNDGSQRGSDEELEEGEAGEGEASDPVRGESRRTYMGEGGERF